MRGASLLTCGALILLSALSLHAQAVQFDASRHDTLALSQNNAVQEWRSVKTGALLIPLHGASNGWGAATLLAPYGVKGTVAFDDANSNAAPSPMAFGGDIDFPVATIFAVIKCDSPFPLSTLIDAPVDIRLETMPSWAFQTEQHGNAIQYRVNGVDTPDFSPSSSFQLVEARFITETGNRPSLQGLYLGGSAPSPLWRRNWRGEIAELLLFPFDPSPDERNAVHRYLSVKWGVPAPHWRDDSAPSILRALGIDAGAAFSTAIIVR